MVALLLAVAVLPLWRSFFLEGRAVAWARAPKTLALVGLIFAWYGVVHALKKRGYFHDVSEGRHRRAHGVACVSLMVLWLAAQAPRAHVLIPDDDAVVSDASSEGWCAACQLDASLLATPPTPQIDVPSVCTVQTKTTHRVIAPQVIVVSQCVIPRAPPLLCHCLQDASRVA